MPLRDAFGHFVRRTEAAEAVEPNLPMSDAGADDGLAVAERALYEAQARLDEHRATAEGRFAAMRELHARREEALVEDDPDRAFECGQRIERAELGLQGLERRDGELSRQLSIAQQRVREVRAVALKPRLDAAYDRLTEAARHLWRVVEEARVLESQAVACGLLLEPKVPGAAAVNGLLVRLAARPKDREDAAKLAEWSRNEAAARQQAHWARL